MVRKLIGAAKRRLQASAAALLLTAAALLLTAAASAPPYAPDPCDRHLQAEHTYDAHHQIFTTDATGRPAQALARTLLDRDARRGRQINQGLMKRIENGARSCLEGEGSVAGYRVRLHYPDRAALAPDRIHVTLSPKVSGVTRRIALTLPNRDLPAGELEKLQNHITDAFQAARCGSDRTIDGISVTRR